MKNSNKNTWAYGVSALFLGFVALMVSLAVIASQHKSSLVVKDYYKAEIQFQQQIDKVENANALAEKPAIHINEKSNTIEVFFPHAIYADGVEGKMHFYRADMPELDFEEAIKLDNNGKQIISAGKLKKGQWKIQLNWQSNGLLYYIEKEVKKL